MARRIETELSIRAVDRFSSELNRMRTVTGRFADGVRTELGRLQNLRGPLRLIEDFRTQQVVVRESGVALQRARERVRELQHAIRTTRQPTAAMRREFQQARNAAERLEQRHAQNRRTLAGLQTQLRQAGVNTADLAGEQNRLVGSIDRVTTAFGRQMDRLERIQTMQTRIADARERMDRSLATSANMSFAGRATMDTGRRILTALSGPIQQAIDFESAMADVRKVVDFDSPEAFRQMSDDILELSTRIPMSAEGIAAIVAAGGQAGIAREDLLAYAEAAAMVGVAFDISADQAGSSMASIRTQLGLSTDGTMLLFDAMNHLSNNMASEAPQLLDFTRSGLLATAQGFGFAAQEALAFGSAMIASGAAPEVAATSFRNMGRALTRGASATDRQREAMETLGLDTVDVARRMQDDAVGTTLDVLDRIGSLPEELRPALISDLFGDEARALAPLLNDVDLLRSALGMVAEESNYAGSASEEYGTRAETTANNIQLMQNHIARLGVAIGEVVLPPLNELLEMAGGVIDRVVEWTRAHPKLTKALVYGTAAVGALAVAGGAVLTAAAGLIGTMAVLRFGMVSLGARAAFAAGDLIGIGTAFRGLRRLPRLALSALLTPLRWTSRLLPRIRWASLAGRLSWRSLITPLSWLGRGALRFIPVIGWAILAGELAWNLLIKPLGWDEYLPTIDWDRVWNAFSWDGWLPSVDWSEILHAIDWPEWVGDFAWVDVLPEWGWDFISEFDLSNVITWSPPPWLEWLRDWINEPATSVPGVIDDTEFAQLTASQQAAVRVLGEHADGEALPTPERLQGLSAIAEELRADVAALRAELDAMPAPQNAYDMPSPRRAELEGQLRGRLQDLEQVERQLAENEVAATALSDAMQVIGETDVSPTINTDSIDAALGRVREIAAELRTLGGETPRTAGPQRPQRVRPAGARAGGGPIRLGLPYLVNERTARSEWIVPSGSGGVLNVSQAQAAFRSAVGGLFPSGLPGLPSGGNAALARLHSGARSLQGATLASLAPALSAVRAAMAPSGGAGQGAGAGRSRGDLQVHINGGIRITAPSGMTDPGAIADLAADRIARRVAGIMDASFTD
ncbi:phage tail tape measure protein [Pararhodobacter sp. CCB-MM2]|uniref:phage tail tape measure protein n=1 Tax=Pararhodobacter sp. CCB-MM2 TaxID=1786003 RepID=UPI000831B695|nr:phage tail tape measure protein [Pararhodobacter sp. CCB-MM2]